MRRILVASLLLGALSLSGCKKDDPNSFDSHIQKIKVADQRGSGFTGLEALTKRIVTAKNQDQLAEFTSKVIPVFEEIWDDAPEQHETMLKLVRDVGDPAAAKIWSKAIELDGSTDARKKTILALEGARKAKAVEASDAIIEELGKVLENPKLDEGKNEEGRLRLLMVQTLGELGDKKAVPVLIKAMEQPKEKQPVHVHRAAAKALGQIGDPAAIDSLLTVTFRVPDVPTTTSVGERSKLALVAIGEPVIPKALQMLRGEHEAVQKLAAEHGLDQYAIQLTAASILGAMQSPAAVDELISFMPKEDCGGRGGGADEAITLRAVIANALGLIRDPKAVEPLCTCIDSTHNPTDMYPIMEALGRIGGDAAVECLVGVVKDGAYDKEVVREGFELEPRWEAARFAILAAKPADVDKIAAAMSANTDATVAGKLKQWQPGLDLLKTCKEDLACYAKTLDDPNADWFSREKAATEVARLAKGDEKMAVKIAKAFKVRNPDARVTMALLPPVMLSGKTCPECVDAYQTVLTQERGSMDAKYQASVLAARAAMAKLRDASQAEVEEKEG